MKTMNSLRRAYPIDPAMICAGFAHRVTKSPFGQYRGLGLDVQSRSVDDKTRTIEFVASTSNSDRYGDVIEQDGWQLDNYRANPVGLFAHDSTAPPIARGLSTQVSNGRLIWLAQFATSDVYPFADTIFKLYKAGFMRAVSVGFMPLDYELVQEDENSPIGVRFKSVELLEISCVTVPANPDALAVNDKNADTTLEKWLQDLASMKPEEKDLAELIDDFLATLRAS